MTNDRLRLKTRTKVWKFDDPEGKIYEFLREGGDISQVEHLAKEKKEVEGNIFLNEGIEYIWKAVTGVSGLTPFDGTHSHIGVGDGTVAEDPTQTGLQGTNKYYKLVDSGYPVINVTKCTWRATFGGTEANFTWNEWTVANGSDDTAVNLNRKVESLGTKSSGATWVLQVELSIS